MSIAYLDTSALVKQYVIEPGSNWVKALLVPDLTPTVFTSHLTVVEAMCAFARRRREGSLSSHQHAQILRAFEYDVQNRLNILDVGPAVIRTAQRLANQHPLRAYDAVQLATAWLANENLVRSEQRPLMFVCADNHLVATAQAEGLLTENPSQYL